jgi:hypothetical protein
MGFGKELSGGPQWLRLKKDCEVYQNGAFDFQGVPFIPLFLYTYEI